MVYPVLGGFLFTLTVRLGGFFRGMALSPTVLSLGGRAPARCERTSSVSSRRSRRPQITAKNNGPFSYHFQDFLLTWASSQGENTARNLRLKRLNHVSLNLDIRRCSP